MKFIGKWGYKIVLIFMLIIWGYITFSSVFNIYPAFDNDTIKLSPIVLFIGVSSLISLLYILLNKFSKNSDKKNNIIALILCIVFFILMCVWGLRYQTIFTYDLNHIEDQVQVLLNNKSMSIGASRYLSVYPHQMPLLMLIYFVKSIAVLIHANPTNMMIIYNCFMVSISSWFLYKTIKELFDSKVALIGLVLMLLMPDFYLYASYYYTDIVSIPYCIIGFYLLVKADKIDNKYKYIYRVLSGLSFAVAFKLRVVCIFLLLAYLICYLFKENLRSNVKRFIPLLSSFVLILVLYSHLLLPMFKLEIDSKKTFPSFHWVMMGANQKYDGGYSSEDYSITEAAKDKTKKNIDMYLKRVKEMKPDFVFTKIRRVWTQGDHDVNRKYKNVSNIDSTYKYLNGPGCIFLKYIQQIILIGIYILFLISIFFDIHYKKTLKNSIHSVFIVSIMFAIIFYLFWEAQVRYSFTFIPWIIIGATYSIVKIKKLFESKKLSIDSFEIDIQKLKKSLGIFVISATIICLGAGLYKYSIRKVNYNFIRYSQYSTNYFIDIKDNVIKQEFIIDKTFNVVELSFKKNGKVDNITYNFELYDVDDNLIYEKEFDSNWAIKKSYATFKIPKQKLNKKKKYILKIYSKNASNDNYLSIGSSLIDNCGEKELTTINNGYDVNTKGETFNNDELICSELRIKLIEKKKTTFFSKKKFLFGSAIVTLGLFTIIYYALIKENKYVILEKISNKKNTNKKNKRKRKK